MKQKILPGVLIGLLLIINISIPMADSLDTSAALYSNTGRSGLGRANVYVGDGDNDGNKEWASVDDSGFVLYEQSGQTYAATTITKPASPNYGCWGRDITAGDYNCDGYDDIIISDPTFDVNGMGATNGRLIIFPGSANGFSANTAWWVDGTYLNGQTGWSIDTGDFNNDGYDDLIIGSPLANSGTGKVDILLGSVNWAGWTLTSSDWYNYGGSNDYYGHLVRSVKNGNDDNYDDFLVFSLGCHTIDIYHGTSSIDMSPPSPSLNSSSSLGGYGTGINYGRDIDDCDLDNDGYNEICTMEYREDTLDLIVYIGSSSGYSGSYNRHTISSFDSQTTAAGYNIVRQGIDNDDDYEDLAISYYDVGIISTADNVIVQGVHGDSDLNNIDTNAWIITSVSLGLMNTFGVIVETDLSKLTAGIPDISGDGKDDLVIGDMESNSVYLYKGL